MIREVKAKTKCSSCSRPVEYTYKADSKTLEPVENPSIECPYHNCGNITSIMHIEGQPYIHKKATNRTKAPFLIKGIKRTQRDQLVSNKVKLMED